MMNRLERFQSKGLEREPLPHPKILLVNLTSERRRSLYEPLGPEVLIGAIKKNLPGQTETLLLDTQIGRLEVEETVKRIKLERPDVLGLSVPQGAWNYAEKILESLSQLHPLDLPLLTLLGNTVPTWAPPEEIFNRFPWVVLVRGEGEEAVVSVIQHLIQGTSWESVPNLAFKRRSGEIAVNPYKPPDLSKYALPERQGLKEIIERGGNVQIEGSRDCPWRGCVFCLKIKGGKYRVIPSETTLQDLEVLDEKGIEELGFADEDFLASPKERKKLAEAINQQGLKINFAITTRVDSLIGAEKEGILDALIEAGLKKVFLGAEGGCNPYLQSLKKGVTLEEVEEAIAILETKGLRKEVAIITFAQDMPFEWLEKNVEFLERHWPDVPSILNEMRVQYGSKEAKRLAKKGLLGEFDLDRLEYEASYEDPLTREVAGYCREWREEEFGLYDALKSLGRTALVFKSDREIAIEDFLVRFKELDFRFLETVTNLVDQPVGKWEMRTIVQRLRRERSDLVAQLKERMERRDEKQILDPRGFLYREVSEFMKRERQRPEKNELGVVAVIVQDGKILMEEKSNRPGKLELPAGLAELYERDEETLKREMKEELGSEVEVGESLLPIRIRDHYDTSGQRFDTLILFPYRVDLKNGVNLELADKEVKDVHWIKTNGFRGNVKKKKYEVDEEVAAFVESLPPG